MKTAYVVAMLSVCCLVTVPLVRCERRVLQQTPRLGQPVAGPQYDDHAEIQRVIDGRLGVDNDLVSADADAPHKHQQIVQRIGTGRNLLGINDGPREWLEHTADDGDINEKSIQATSSTTKSTWEIDSEQNADAPAEVYSEPTSVYLTRVDATHNGTAVTSTGYQNSASYKSTQAVPNQHSRERDNTIAALARDLEKQTRYAGSRRGDGHEQMSAASLYATQLNSARSTTTSYTAGGDSDDGQRGQDGSRSDDINADFSKKVVAFARPRSTTTNTESLGRMWDQNKEKGARGELLGAKTAVLVDTEPAASTRAITYFDEDDADTLPLNVSDEQESWELEVEETKMKFREQLSKWERSEMMKEHTMKSMQETLFELTEIDAKQKINEIEMQRTLSEDWEQAVDLQKWEKQHCHQVIHHKPIHAPPQVQMPKITKPNWVKGTPPTFTPGTPGSWTPGRPPFFTPGFWTAGYTPKHTKGTKPKITPGTLGYVVPGEFAPGTFLQGYVLPGWTETTGCDPVDYSALV